MSAKKKGDEVDKALLLDMGDHRIRAALRVLGITRESLLPETKPSEGGAPGSPLAQKRLEIREKKRLSLLAEVEATAELLSEDKVEEILVTSSMNDFSHSVNRGNSNTAAVLAKEQEKLDELKKKSKEEVRKIVTDNLIRNQKAEEGVRKNEEANARLQQLKNQRRLEVEARRKEQAKKEATMKDSQRKLREKKEEEGREVMSHLNGVFEKLQREADEAEQAKYQKELNWRLKLDERRAQAAEEARAAREARNEQVRHAEEKAARAQERVDEHTEVLRQKAAAGSAKFAQKRQYVKDTNEQDEADRMESFRKSTEHLVQVREEGRRLRSQSAKDLRDSCNKRRTMVNKNLEALDNVFKEKARAMFDKVEADVSGQNRRAFLAEERARREGQRGIMLELYTENRERMAHMEEYGHGDSLRGISTKVDKVNNILEQRQEILEQRAATMKETLREKDQLHEMMVTMKSAPPEKMNKLLKSMDMQPVVLQTGGEEKKEEK